MKRKKDGWCAFGARGAGLALGVLVLLFGFALSAAAQSKTAPPGGTGQPGAEPGQVGSFSSYVPPGFSIEGPIAVLSVTPEAISLLTGKESRPIVLNLQGMQVNVRDEKNKSLSLRDIQKGSTVYVCRKPGVSQMFIFVVPQKERRNDA